MTVKTESDARWHVLTASEALRELGSRAEGLSSEEAGERLRRHGPNRLPESKPPSLFQVALRQFRSPLIYVLAAAGVVSLAIGETTDAGFIFAVLLLNAAIGGFEEWRAEKSSRALQRLLRTRATVLRDGQAREVDAEEVVPGDVVWLESGNRVPADLRLVTTHGLEVDESLLTGESLPVTKDEGSLASPGTPLGDRAGMAHAGSVVARGRAVGVTVATGAETVVGRLAVEVSKTHGGKPPLLERLERFTRVVGVTVLVAAVVVALIGVLGRGHSIQEMFLFAVALAVSAIPEGLPIALTVALAIATTRMLKRGVIVRRLAAVEGLGSCTLIASDKTGTLTCNEITVRALIPRQGEPFFVGGEGYAPLGAVERAGRGVATGDDPWLDRCARIAALCNEAALQRSGEGWQWRGDPTDVALLSFAQKAGLARAALLERLPQVNQIAFEPERKFAASFHAEDGGTLVAVKGAPERVLEMCALPAQASAELLAVAARMAAEGQRVLALADGHLPRVLGEEEVPAEPDGLELAGFAGMIDPLRPGVVEAIARCRQAGIDVAMVTGDHPVTALAIARELALATEEGEVVTGAQLAALAPAELPALIARARVFARVAPEQKLQIVNAARQAGHFVAVTGDGVNDAPALRAANIGVAMGRGGTDVAREAAELVLTDDDFGQIVAGVEEGRVAYDNVRKVIYLLISTGAAEVVLVASSVAVGLPLPLQPVQLLWLNLVTNGIQDVALAFEPKEADVLERPPRGRAERVFDRLMIERTLLAAVVMGGVALAAFAWMIDRGFEESEARNTLLLLMVLFEIAHIGNARSETISMLRLSPLASPILLFGSILAFTVHLLAMHVPFLQRVLGTAPVDPRTWGVLALLALTIAVAGELHKLWWRARHPRWGR